MIAYLPLPNNLGLTRRLYTTLSNRQISPPEIRLQLSPQNWWLHIKSQMCPHPKPQPSMPCCGFSGLGLSVFYPSLSSLSLPFRYSRCYSWGSAFIPPAFLSRRRSQTYFDHALISNTLTIPRQKADLTIIAILIR